MAKQTGLLEVIFKITVKNVMGESSGCLPVAVHMSLILLMKTILIVRLTSLWTSRIFTQKPCRYELSGTAVLSRFCSFSPLLCWTREGGTCGSVLCSDCFDTIFETHTEPPCTAALFFPHPVYHRSPKFEGAALISNALTRPADATLVQWDVINRCVGLRNSLLRHSAGLQFIPLDCKGLPLCFV